MMNTNGLLELLIVCIDLALDAYLLYTVVVQVNTLYCFSDHSYFTVNIKKPKNEITELKNVTVNFN
jgi:hypothetical protein